MEKLKAVSLFSGCGGMDLGMLGGFEYLGKRYSKSPVELVYAIDNDPYACEIFNVNFDQGCVEGDIRQIESSKIPPHHILIGGFPCQSFSIIAQNPPRLGNTEGNGRLFFEMHRILLERKPLCVIAENVKGILSANNGQAFPLILKKLEEASYHVKYAVLDASDFGIPQRRERVFIVGFRDRRIYDKFSFPEPTTPEKKIPLRTSLIPDKEIDGKYYFSERAVNGMMRVREKMNKGRVQDINRPCNTVGAHLAKVSLNSTDPVLLMNGRYRRFTPREAARIQSFPEDFILKGADGRQYRAIGNAVPPVIMWHVTQAVVRAIRKVDKNILSSDPYRTKTEIRSYNMSQIKGEGTGIENRLGEALRERGLSFEKNVRGLPGTPDIVFRNEKVAVFCDSAFWHGRNYKRTVAGIKTNQAYWKKKIGENIARDRKVERDLRNAGWIVLRVWDSEIENNIGNLTDLIINTISARSPEEKGSPDYVHKNLMRENVSALKA